MRTLAGVLALLGAVGAAPAAAQDSDRDGVPDTIDQCPSTPAGGRILSDGCMPRNDCRRPREGEAADDKGCAVEHVYVLRGVKFEFDSDVLTEGGRVALKDVATVMQSYPDLAFELDGHTCNMGSDAYNLRLSDRRAVSAAGFLVREGINVERVHTRGSGEARPIDTNDTREGRENNRRVELRILN